MHELNNPLATSAACAESMTLQQQESGGAPSEMLRIIDLEVERCKKIVDGLLDFSRPKPASRSEANLNDIVSQALFLLRHHPHYKRVAVSVEPSDAPLPVHANADQLVQVVIALAMNAFDATPDGARVVFRTMVAQRDDGALLCRLEVEDEGPGIPRAVATRIFEPFFSTKPQGKGTGLGLAICFGIVNDHGGNFELVAPDGPGATFRVDLPLSAGNASHEEKE